MESDELIAEIKDLLKQDKNKNQVEIIVDEEEEFLQLYNEKLIRKLEQKMLELEKKNTEKNLLINKLRRSEKDLIAAKNEAEKSDNLKTEFIAQMSHEIRTPINNILLFSNLLKEEYSGGIPEELENSFKILDRASKRVIRTIELLIEISQAQTGTLEVSPENIDVHELIMEDLYLKFKKYAKEKKLEFKINRETDDTFIFVDRYTLKEMISHLLDNALKFTKTGGIEVRIRKSKDKLAIDIIDTGIGISKTYKDRLFQAFTQEDEGVTRRYEGCGLGLALVKKYSAINNAKITVFSKKGEGSKFTLYFNK